MKRIEKTIIVLLLGTSLVIPLGCGQLPDEDDGYYPYADIRLIFDSDIGPDCDDAGAAALLHALADLGEVQIIGMMCCTSSPWGAPCLDAINTYYGRPDIPIGTYKVSGFLTFSSYNELIARNFPTDLQHGDNAPDATTLYRQLLAGQPDNSVVICATGSLNNLRILLQSEPDQYSSKTGLELVSQKVIMLSVMGGAYPNGVWEFNFGVDAASAGYVVDNWPTNMTFSGFEIGYNIMTGALLSSETPESNPVRMAYQLHTSGESNYSFDQTSMLYAVRGKSWYWQTVATGRNQVNNIGGNRWQYLNDLDHNFLHPKATDYELEVEIENLMVKPPLLP